MTAGAPATVPPSAATGRPTAAPPAPTAPGPPSDIGASSREAAGSASRAPTAIAAAASEAVRLPLNSCGAITILIACRQHHRRAQTGKQPGGHVENSLRVPLDNRTPVLLYYRTLVLYRKENGHAQAIRHPAPAPPLSHPALPGLRRGHRSRGGLRLLPRPRP